MTERFGIGLAERSDNEPLKELIAGVDMDGEIRVSFRREPDFFLGERAGSLFSQTIVARELNTGEIAGFGSRSVKMTYINGQRSHSGYLGGLRMRPLFRKGTLLARGYRFMKELHGDRRAALYLTAIGEGNREAEKLLTSGKAGLPSYMPYGEYRAAAVAVCRRKRDIGIEGVRIERGTASDLDEIVSCLNRNGREKQFYPVYGPADFTGEDAAMAGIGPEDFFIARRGGRVTGVAACWDQSDYRQTVIAGYGGRLRLVRPLYNIVARLAGYSPLPDPGKEISFFNIACIAVDGNDPCLFGALLRRIYNDSAGGPFGRFILGLHRDDPLNSVLDDYSHIDYITHIYIVCWEDGLADYGTLDGRVPYLELGTL